MNSDHLTSAFGGEDLQTALPANYNDLPREEKLAALDAYLDALPCNGCAHDANPNWPVTDDLCRCSRCDWAGSSSYLHKCKTGRREPVCWRCNASIGADSRSDPKREVK